MKIDLFGQKWSCHSGKDGLIINILMHDIERSKSLKRFMGRVGSIFKYAGCNVGSASVIFNLLGILGT